MVKHTQKIRRQQPKIVFSVLDNFVRLELKGLNVCQGLKSISASAFIVNIERIFNCLTNIFRSSRRRCFERKGFLRNFAKFTGKHLRQSLFFNKVAGLRPATLLKKRLWHRCFPVNFAKFLRTFFTEYLWTTASFSIIASEKIKKYLVF